MRRASFMPSGHCAGPSGHRGYSLVELVMVMVIVGIIGVTVASLLSSGVGAFAAGREAVDTLSELRLAGERIARELRTVRRDPGAPADFDFITSTAVSGSSVQFRRLENDGSTVTTVTIDTVGTDLRLAYTTPAGSYTLSERLGSVTFAYLQQNGTTAATGDNDVAFVEIVLSLTDANGNIYPQRTRVALRNRQ
ncbi:MAG TPA: type II secretion system protein [Gammaproteobacteria bacterium]